MNFKTGNPNVGQDNSLLRDKDNLAENLKFEIIWLVIYCERCEL